MVTLKDVARVAGVSASTVSLVINKKRYVEEETKIKVLKAIKELDYHPNILAKSLQTGKSYIIGLIVSDITNPFFPEIVRGVELRSVNKGYDTFLCNTDYNPKRTAAVVNRLIEKKVDGTIIITLEKDDNLLVKLTSNKIPVVLLDWDKTGPLVSNIKENFTNGLKEAIDHLVKLGHHNITFISGPLKFKTAENRKNTFLALLKEYSGKINKPAIIEEDFKVRGGESAAEKILDLPHLPTAIIASNDLMAIGLIKKLKEKGFKVPDDFSVIGFNDIMLSSFIDPPLTTINVPRYRIGQIAWNLLYALIQSKNKMGTEEIVNTILVVRGTTGKAKEPLIRLRATNKSSS